MLNRARSGYTLCPMSTRAIGYVRVSMAREEMISPEIQRAAIEEHCRRSGYVLADVVEDLDRTGRNFARAGVQAVISRIEAGDAEVAVVWKVSRFGRTRKDWYVASDRIDVAGGRLESATEGYDAATSMGKFTRGMLVELAAFESDRIGEGWKEAHANRRARGLPAQGGDRYGYTRDGDTFTPDPVTGEILARMYGWAADGMGRASIARRLNDEGIPGPKGAPWYADRVARILDSGFGAGLISHGIRSEATWTPGAHEPVVSEDVWLRYRAQRAARAGDKSTGKHRYVLSGLMRCGVDGCGAGMNSDRLGRHAGYGFACSAWRAGKHPTCVTVSQSRAEAVVLDWLKDYAEAIEQAASEAPAPAPAGVRQAARAQRDRQEAERALAKLTAGWAAGIVPDGAYTDARDILTEKVETARRREAAAEVARTAPTVEARGLLEEWPTLSVEARRSLLGALIEAVEVVPGERRGLRPTVTVIPVEALR